MIGAETKGGSMLSKRIVGIAGVLGAIGAIIALNLIPAGAATGHMVIGAIGGDFHAVASAGGDDWGAVATVPGGAATKIIDGDVAVVDDQAPVGVVSSDQNDHACNGTFRQPTAPLDMVCVYISNGDNAVDVHGVSIAPGATGGSKYGFKIVWSTPTDDADTFIEAVWAYHRPA